jgi:hypothetical protein
MGCLAEMTVAHPAARSFGAFISSGEFFWLIEYLTGRPKRRQYLFPTLSSSFQFF